MPHEDAEFDLLLLLEVALDGPPAEKGPDVLLESPHLALAFELVCIFGLLLVPLLQKGTFGLVRFEHYLRYYIS